VKAKYKKNWDMKVNIILVTSDKVKRKFNIKFHMIVKEDKASNSNSTAGNSSLSNSTNSTSDNSTKANDKTSCSKANDTTSC